MSLDNLQSNGDSSVQPTVYSRLNHNLITGSMPGAF